MFCKFTLSPELVCWDPSARVWQSGGGAFVGSDQVYKTRRNKFTTEPPSPWYFVIGASTDDKNTQASRRVISSWVTGQIIYPRPSSPVPTQPLYTFFPISAQVSVIPIINGGRNEERKASNTVIEKCWWESIRPYAVKFTACWWKYWAICCEIHCWSYHFSILKCSVLIWFCYSIQHVHPEYMRTVAAWDCACLLPGWQVRYQWSSTALCLPASLVSTVLWIFPNWM